MTNYRYWLKITSNSWSFIFAIIGQITYLVADLTPDCARSWISLMELSAYAIVVVVCVSRAAAALNSFKRKNSGDGDLIVGGDSKGEEEEHLALTVPAPALHSSIYAFEDSDQTEPFKEGETAATPPLSAYRVAARI
nr:hypothetical protein [Tanacetum cinerariifolium]